jgi:hypothetical protein
MRANASLPRMKTDTQKYFEFSEPIVHSKRNPARLPEQPGHGVQARNDSFADQSEKKIPDRLKIYLLLQLEQYFVSGLTRDEISKILGMAYQTVCGRVHELLDAKRWPNGVTPVYETVLRRPTSLGKSASVVCARSQTEKLP